MDLAGGGQMIGHRCCAQLVVIVVWVVSEAVLEELCFGGWAIAAGTRFVLSGRKSWVGCATAVMATEGWGSDFDILNWMGGSMGKSLA